jgi:hypothetical protein
MRFPHQVNLEHQRSIHEILTKPIGQYTWVWDDARPQVTTQLQAMPGTGDRTQPHQYLLTQPVAASRRIDSVHATPYGTYQPAELMPEPGRTDSGNYPGPQQWQHDPYSYQSYQGSTTGYDERTYPYLSQRSDSAAGNHPQQQDIQDSLQAKDKGKENKDRKQNR